MSSDPLFQHGFIVLVGKFNTTIFQPKWFASEGILRQEDYENEVEIEIMHRDITSFHVGEKYRFEITPDRFQVGSQQPIYMHEMADMVLQIFKLLSHTPIGKLGINYQAQFKIDSVEQLENAFSKFAPSEPWDGILQQPSLSRLVFEGKRPDKYSGRIRITVEASKQVGLGVYVDINDHFELEEKDNITGCSEIMGILSEQHKKSRKRSLEIAKKFATSMERTSYGVVEH